MKKIAKVIIITLISFLFNLNAQALDRNSPVYSDMTYTQCVEYQDSARTTSGSGYFGHCLKATCYSGVWETYYYISGNMVTCNNGNEDYYVEYVRTGCGNYSGTCVPTTRTRYCNLITYYDCGRKSNGTSFTTTTRPQTTLSPQTTTRATTRLPITQRPTTTRPLGTTSTTEDVQKNNDNYIKALEINNIDLLFNKDLTTYNIQLDKEINTLDLKIELSAETSKYEVINNDPIDREHPVKIIVTAEDNTTREYIFNIKDLEDPLDSNSFLKEIVIEDYSIDFKKDVYTYSLKLEKEVEELNINVQTEEETSTYHISGNENLKNRSKIKITVKAEDASETIYTINIKKDTNTSKVIIVILVVLMAIFVLGKLFKKLASRKVSESNYEYE